MEENIPQKNWWSRNWKWALPTGGCLLVIVMLIVFVGTLFYGVSTMIGDSQAHIEAIEKVKENEQAVAILGEPIETDGISGGSVSYENGLKTAQLTIPIKGPKGKATIRVEGEGADTHWIYDKMLVFIDDSDVIIDLLETNASSLEDF